MIWSRIMARKKHVFIPDALRKVYEKDIETINFYRRNPCIACEHLLGIKLLDYQKYILQSTWTATASTWAVTRNGAKSLLGAVIMILKGLLFENQNIYIISSVGDQAKETFNKIEEIATRLGRTVASIPSLKDILAGETVKNPTNKTGFSHPVSGYVVEFYNGSKIYTLNSKPDNVRGKRATFVFFDEAAFCAEELLLAAQAFTAQDTTFKASTEVAYNPELDPKICPTQIVYASSQDTNTTLFYKNYKEFAKKMIIGNSNYFACDLTCEVAMNTFMDGKPYAPLLAKNVVDDAMKANKEKALREYYNEPASDAIDGQIIKWSSIRSNEKFTLPQLQWFPNCNIVLAFDPARINDNSILGAMNLYEDEKLGLCGQIINCINFTDTATKGKYKLDTTRQLNGIRNTIAAYNGQHPDYEFIDSILIDAGSGGAGVSAYGDGLLADWVDDNGFEHKGLIDATYDVYESYVDKYPNAINKIIMVNPKKYRTQMFNELIELMGLGVIKFPYEYSNQSVLRISDGSDAKGEELYHIHDVSIDEGVALCEIDMMKTEITSIHKFTNAENTSVNYALATEKQNKMHDDRAYVLALLAHRLYQLRRSRLVETDTSAQDDIMDLLKAYRAPKIK